MSYRTPATVLIAGCLLVAGVLIFFSAQTIAQAQEEPEQHQESVLEQSMGQLNRGFRSMRRAVRSGDFAKILEELPAMQAGAIKAKGETPPIIARVEDQAEQLKKLKEFRLQMITLVESLLALEKAALAEDRDQVLAAVEKLREVQKSGHDAFQEPEEGGGDDEDGDRPRGGRRGGRPGGSGGSGDGRGGASGGSG